MKVPGYILASLCLLEFGLGSATGADIYAYTDADGSVSLTNVPADNRYSMFVSERDGALPLPDSGRPTISHTSKARYEQIVEEAARAHGLEGALLHAVISVESHYNPKAVSKKGAAGLMQLMPATAKRYGVADSFDPVQNIEGGAKYLRDLLNLFNKDVSLALAAYNAGENAVVRSGNRIPPFRETRDYVPKVLGLYRKYQVNL